jgi:hypothetical protein
VFEVSDLSVDFEILHQVPPVLVPIDSVQAPLGHRWGWVRTHTHDRGPVIIPVAMHQEFVVPVGMWGVLMKCIVCMACAIDMYGFLCLCLYTL